MDRPERKLRLHPRSRYKLYGVDFLKTLMGPEYQSAVQMYFKLLSLWFVLPNFLLSVVQG